MKAPVARPNTKLRFIFLAPAVQFSSTWANLLSGEAVVRLTKIARNEAERLRAELGAAEGMSETSVCLILGHRTSQACQRHSGAKVKALSRCLEEWADQSDTLMPVADLYREVQKRYLCVHPEPGTVVRDERV